MSYAQLRQSELFAGSNWSTVYRAFSQVDLQSYDFDTIRVSLIEYIQRNYPEEFNDWSSNQELLFIIDMIAYLGQSLAFRTDLNSRENFLDTASRRESVLRLAKMLGYNPKRNYPARGVLKLTQVKTTEDVRDSNGINLANTSIKWDDPTSLDWYERFILILNSSFINTNTFGIPVKTATIGGINTQLYRVNSAPLKTVADTFSADINGQSMNFEVVNPDFDPLGFFIERAPDPLAGKHLIYRNDGAGNSSANTGFFAYFKQGTLRFNNYEFQYPEENRIVDIDIDNINELDVWVQEINDSGLTLNTWTKVPTVENVVYNSIDRQERKIYSVVTRDNDQVSIRFGDGRFGRSPTGLFRVWYRTSNGISYQIQSNDMQNIQIVIPYLKNNSGTQQTYNLTLTFSLQYGISNRDVGGSLPRETSAHIKQRAPQMFYTQNRMVNGEDYNIFPLQSGNQIRKSKAINRVYSGQSRFIDVNDPTGRYQNTNIYGDDGILYREEFTRRDFENLPTVKTPADIVQTKIVPLINTVDIKDFFYTLFPRVTIEGNPYPTRWYRTSGSETSGTGQFTSDTSLSGVFGAQPIGDGTPYNYPYLKEGALIKFKDRFDPSQTIWAKIEQVSGTGVDPLISEAVVGPVVLNEDITSGWEVEQVIPSFRQVFNETESSDIEDEIFAQRTFALRYDPFSSKWVVVTMNNIGLAKFSLTNAGDTTNTNKDNSWLLLAEYLPGSGFWQFTTRNLRYVFESVETCRFFFMDDFKVVDVQRRAALRDYIRLLKYNMKPSPNPASLGRTYDWTLVAPFVYSDGFIEPRRIQVTFPDRDDDGVPDDPDYFDYVVDPSAVEPGAAQSDRYVFQKKVLDLGYEYYEPFTAVAKFNTYPELESSPVIATGQICFVIEQQKFYTKNEAGSIIQLNDEYKAFIGRNDFHYQWKHFAPEDHRIDPAITNIIDMYVLPESYHQSVQTWLKSVNRPAFPLPPTNDDLRQQFSNLENFKMVSDEIVWHSARFKKLFGDGASEELRAQIKVIKLPGTTLTDNEIKQRVISAVNEFFAIDNWAFGESVYFSECSAYIHQQLATIISGVALVPLYASSSFGNLQEIRAEPDELFLSTATVSDVVIVDSFTPSNLRMIV